MIYIDIPISTLFVCTIDRPPARLLLQAEKGINISCKQIVIPGTWIELCDTILQNNIYFCHIIAKLERLL